MLGLGRNLVRTAKLGALALIVAGCLGGCGQLVQWLVGDPDPVDGPKNPPTLAEKAAEAASGIPGPIGIIGGGLLALLNGLQAYQNRKLKSSGDTLKEGFRGVVVGIDRSLEAGTKESVTKEDLYREILARISSVEILGLIAKIKAEERST